MTQTHLETSDPAMARTPRWVKVFGIIAAVLVALFIVLHLTGNSPGGPHSHLQPASPLKHERHQP
jgi:hypothetical protein